MLRGLILVPTGMLRGLLRLPLLNGLHMPEQALESPRKTSLEGRLGELL